MQFGKPIVDIEVDLKMSATETTETLSDTCSDANAFELHKFELNMTPQEKEFMEGDRRGIADAHRGDGSAASSTSV